MLILTFWVLYN